MELEEILTGDIPPPGKPMPSPMLNRRIEEQVAIAGAADGAPRPFLTDTWALESPAWARVNYGSAKRLVIYLC